MEDSLYVMTYLWNIGLYYAGNKVENLAIDARTPAAALRAALSATTVTVRGSLYKVEIQRSSDG